MLDKPDMELMSQGHLLEEELGETKLRRKHIKLRQRQREADSPEFISPHSTTDIMDTDEAQEINKQIIEKMEKEPEGSEYLNIVSEGKYEMWEKHWYRGHNFNCYRNAS